MAKRKGNKMATQAVAATGLRVIGMYVQEYFHWGWQPYGQENDDGIDGEIIPRYKNGDDMGVRIYIQSKSGPSFLRSNRKKEYFKIQPYNYKGVLNNHIDSWHRFHEPVILVYTNAEKNKDGKNYLDLKNPVAWWVRMDNYEHDGSSEIIIQRKNLFQEHTKGILKEMIKPYVKNWSHYPAIKPTKKDLFLWNSYNNLKIESKKYYSQWAASKPTIYLYGKEHEILVSRTGWRHINDKRRKERVALSMRLLPIAQEILKQSKDIRTVILRSKELPTDWNSITEHIGFRARVQLDGVERKVQVVVKRYKNLDYKKEKFWFYSVHIVK